MERRCSLNLNQGHISSGIENVGRLYHICAACNADAEFMSQFNSHIFGDL